MGQRTRRDTAWKPHPAPIVSISLQPGIPWRVALPQSPPPLPRPWTSMQQSAGKANLFPANGNLSPICWSHQTTALQIVPAVEDRLKAAVLYSGGLASGKARPEVDQINFVSRVKIPVLMLNGRYDAIEPPGLDSFELLSAFVVIPRGWLPPGRDRQLCRSDVAHACSVPCRHSRDRLSAGPAWTSSRCTARPTTGKKIIC